jgi:murein L,D-transpeptidase YcbB/YkuD
MRWLALVMLMLLASCQQSGNAQQSEAAALQKAQAEIARLKQENADLMAEKGKAENAKSATKTANANAGKPMDYYDDADMAAADKVEADSQRKLCWQDYCPCDSPETALDTTICRNARGGIDMSDEQWAIGAQARDSKREGDRLTKEMDAIISDMRSSRY